MTTSPERKAPKGKFRVIGEWFGPAPGYGDEVRSWLVGDFDSLEEAWRVARHTLETKPLGVVPEVPEVSLRGIIYNDEGTPLPVPEPEPMREGVEERAARSDEFDQPITRTDPEGDVDAWEQLEEPAEQIELRELEEAGELSPVVKLVNSILVEALRRQAGYIHLEPEENALRVRHRIAGVLHDALEVPKKLQPGIVARLKILADMDIAEKRLPQDGTFTVRYSGREVSFWVSSLPARFGEKIVLRVFDEPESIPELAELGFAEDDLERFQKAIRKAAGVVIVVGPSGSGRSATLYAALASRNSRESHIMTAEYGFKYRLPRATQVQVRPAIGFTIGSAVRSFLRHDPDVILVGEMSDYETTELAFRAAARGTLVFATMNLSDGAGTMLRLLNMGLEPFVVASLLLTVVAQRLCRRVCRECREPVQLPQAMLLSAGFSRKEAKSVILYRGKGCAQCAQTGYQGYTVLHEVLTVTPELQEAIVKAPSPQELRQIATKQGMRTLRQDGLRQVALELTTLDEVFRVLP